MAKMSNRAKEALCGSIEKWIGIVEGYIEDRGVNNCPLCALYHSYGGCSFSCPVKRRTERNFCVGSPYDDFDRRKDADADKMELKRLAIAELEFLISLWPENEGEENNGNSRQV